MVHLQEQHNVPGDYAIELEESGCGVSHSLGEEMMMLLVLD